MPTKTNCLYLLPAGRAADCVCVFLKICVYSHQPARGGSVPSHDFTVSQASLREPRAPVEGGRRGKRRTEVRQQRPCTKSSQRTRVMSVYSERERLHLPVPALGTT